MDKFYRNFDEVESYIGLEAANQIRLKFPGLKLYIPKTANPESELVKTIGLEAAQELGDYMGGDWLRVPSGKAEAAMRSSREKRDYVRQRIADGAKVDDVALETGFSDRWIYQILADGRPKTDPNQIEMFPSE